ncbi:MAG: ROK family protein [Acidimicrobiia bacterium]|nr:ROK family protein [Acidimicrobiia bacterium]
MTDLIVEGLVEEAGVHPSEGGRPVSRLSTRRAGAFALGVDVGESSVVVDLYDLGLQRVDRETGSAGHMVADPEAIVKTLASAVETIRSRNEHIEDRLVGLGLGLPGIVETGANGTATLHAQSLGWEPVDLDALTTAVGIPVLADNGATTMAIAEAWRGSARGVSHGIAVLLGRGVGSSVIVDGSVLRGLSSSAGEWGHTTVMIGGRRCPCGARGCLEAYIGSDAIIQRWKEAGGNPRSDEDAITELIRAGNSQEATAVKVLDETIEILSSGLANLVNLFNPEKIIIGGWIGLALADLGLKRIEDQVRAHALHSPGRHFSLEVSELGNDAVSLGAGILPILRLIDGHND